MNSEKKSFFDKSKDMAMHLLKLGLIGVIGIIGLKYIASKSLMLPKIS